jgi:hypothetical protein
MPLPILVMGNALIFLYTVCFRITWKLAWSQPIWRLATYSSAGVDNVKSEEWTRFGRQEDLEGLLCSLAWHYFAEHYCNDLWTVVPLRMRASVICVLPFDFHFTTRAVWCCVSAIFRVYRPEDAFAASTRSDPHLLGIGLWWHREPVW